MTPRRLACRAAAAALAAALALAAAPAPRVAAQAGDSLELAKRRELEEVRRMARENREAASRLRGRESQELTRLRRTERALNMARKRLGTLQRRRRNLDQQLQGTRVDLERSVLSLDQRRQQLARRLRGLYKYGTARELEFLLSPRSFGQLLARWDFLVMVAEQDRTMLEDVRSRKEEVEANQQRLELNLTSIQRTARHTTAENERLDGLRRERESSMLAIQAQRKNYESAAAELDRTARSIQRLLQELERDRKAESARAKAEGRAPQPYSGDFAKGQGSLDWPLRGRLIGHLGPETHPKWGTVTPNNGIDIEATIGTPVRAVARGRVDYTSEDYGTYGQMIILNHGDGYFTLYGHLSEIEVAVGQEVETGREIARSGDSGSLKGPILHFEVRKGGSPLDPEAWLK
ncbi:MAG TPA: peptidoglycan DD-metalloendopeptidase family protein [Candidatus Eisenbacteria bacterium]|jgi:septal ring factor EnvC (AmiA/AmiB activator)